MPRPSASSRSRLLPLILAASVVAGCTSDAAPPSEELPAGTIRVAYPEWPATLNPVTEPSPGARDILRAVLPSFHVVTPDLEYRPSLLAGEPRVEVEGDRMEISFLLRDDARWSDGTPVTVRDVAFTVRVMQTQRIERADPEGFDHVVEVLGEAPRRGRLILSPPLPAWRELFSAGRFVLPAADDPSEVEDWDRGPPLSGGPFTVGRVIPGRSVTLEAHPRFWGSGPSVRRIEVVAVPDPTTALQLLRDGLVDVVAPMLGVSWSHRLAGLSDVETGGSFGAALVALVANVARLPDRTQRRLLLDAVDRARFASVIVRAEGRRADGVLPPEIGGAVPAWEGYGQGPSQRVGVLGELRLVYVRTELLELAARFLQAEVRRAGGDLELVGLEPDVFWGTFLLERRFDLALIEVRGGPSPDLGMWWGPPDGVWSSLTGLPDPGVGVSTEEAQERLAEEGAVLPLFQPRTSMGWRRGIAGVMPNPSADGPLWNAGFWSISDV